MPIRTLRLNNLGPFEQVEFEFDLHVNAFVGPNNCGKTSVLLALANVILDSQELPRKFIRPGSSFAVGIAIGSGQASFHGTLPVEEAKEGPSAAFRQNLPQLGFRTFVPALRVSTDFRSEGPLAKKAKRGWLFVKRLDEEAVKDQTETTLWIRDEKVIQQMIELDYRSYREERPAIRELLNTIGQLAAEITEGFQIEFAGIGEDKLGLFPQFRTPDGVVPFNVLSQGTQSLIQWIAQLVIGYAQHYDFPNNLREKAGVLLVDEIDAHLHPSWQRRILPVISNRFPSLQIFCAAHSPMTLAGLKAGQVQLLQRDSKGRIQVSRNESDILGWSADEIYTTFFGVEPTDLVTAEKLDRVRRLRRKSKLNPAEKRELNSLRKDLQYSLRSGPTDEQAERLAKELRDAATGVRR